MILLVLLLSGCIYAKRPTGSIRQTLPSIEADYAVYLGCVRAVARLAIRSNSTDVWTMKEIMQFCEEVRQSFDTDKRLKPLQRT